MLDLIFKGESSTNCERFVAKTTYVRSTPRQPINDNDDDNVAPIPQGRKKRLLNFGLKDIGTWDKVPTDTDKMRAKATYVRRIPQCHIKGDSSFELCSSPSIEKKSKSHKIWNIFGLKKTSGSSKKTKNKMVKTDSKNIRNQIYTESTTNADGLLPSIPPYL